MILRVLPAMRFRDCESVSIQQSTSPIVLWVWEGSLATLSLEFLIWNEGRHTYVSKWQRLPLKGSKVDWFDQCLNLCSPKSRARDKDLSADSFLGHNPGSRSEGMERSRQGIKLVKLWVGYCCGQVGLSPAGKTLRNHIACISELFL